jgi:hypothetical protein
MDTSVFITDNNIIIDDSDSDTSSTSTVEELNTFKNEKSGDSNIKSELMDRFVKPIQSHMYLDKDKSLEIEDGFEVSLLRLLHIWFSSDGVINFNNLTKHMDLEKTESIELEDFFLDNPGVMTDSDFYSTEAGIKIRKSWYEFLSNRAFFSYVNKSHQLAPDNANFFNFIKNFFPLVNFYENLNYNEQEKLNIIYKAFSFSLNKFHVVYSTYTRADNELGHKGFVHNIFINDIELFVLESTSIRKLNNLDQIYWTKTELKYS